MLQMLACATTRHDAGKRNPFACGCSRCPDTINSGIEANRHANLAGCRRLALTVWSPAMAGGAFEGSGTQIVPDDVADLGKFAYGLAQDVQSALQSVRRDVDILTSSAWLGEAGKAFGGGWKECYEGGKEVLDALTAMAAKLGTTADNFRDQDAQTAQDVSTANPYRINV